MDIRVASRPFISVIMPVYNRADFVAEAVESILRQSFPHFELIIVDGASTDASRSLITSYAERDHRIRPVFLDRRGIVMQMNEGILLAGGEWIARMDSDDVALPDRLALTLDWAERNGLDVCGGQAEVFGAREKTLWFPEEHEAIGRELLFRAPVLYPTAMFRAAVLKDNLRDVDSAFDDYELFTRLAPRYRMGNTPRVLLRYRSHETQATTVKSMEFFRDFQRYRFRYFFETHPGTPLADYLPLARLSDRRPHPSLEELKRAGRWLDELADYPDEKLRRRMARRWREACERSASPGEEVETVFRQFPALTGEEEVQWIV